MGENGQIIDADVSVHERPYPTRKLRISGAKAVVASNIRVKMILTTVTAVLLLYDTLITFPLHPLLVDEPNPSYRLADRRAFP